MKYIVPKPDYVSLIDHHLTAAKAVNGLRGKAFHLNAAAFLAHQDELRRR